MNVSFVRKFLAQRLPVTKEFSVSLAGKSIIYQSSLYDGVGRLLYWVGADGYERETMEVFRKLVTRAQTFIDIGANTGIFTLAAGRSNPSISIHAFEPVPEIFRVLKRHVEMNGLSENCRCNELAVGEQEGIVPLHIPFETMASASLNPDGFRDLEGKVVTVRSVTLDGYIRQAFLKKVDLVKIDVEGFEAQVLRGGCEMITRDRPSIICECLPAADTESIESLLKPLDYIYFQLTDSGSIKRERIVPDETGRFQNYLFTVQNKLL